MEYCALHDKKVKELDPVCNDGYCHCFTLDDNPILKYCYECDECKEDDK